MYSPAHTPPATVKQIAGLAFPTSGHQPPREQMELDKAVMSFLCLIPPGSGPSSLLSSPPFIPGAKKYKKVTGKEIYSDTLESTPMLEKEKFPQDYFPECKWSRKGFIRTRWCIADCAFDLVNIHLFHDASNLVAWETSPSVYSGVRHKALGYVLDRIIDQRFEKVSYFVFGDFNFRLDSKSVVETLCTKATMQTVRAADTNEVVKLIFRESDNDRKVVLQLEKKLFDYFNQDVFRDNNGTALLEFDKELSVFKDRLYELDISFPPSYPYSEDSSQGEQYMNTRCPAWCDRILMSLSAKELVLKSESEEKVATYDHIGPNVCMGDHKPVFLAFRIAPGAAFLVCLIL
ncbi:hypothetical protein STEG23_026245 [Scotinomys teguina]